MLFLEASVTFTDPAVFQVKLGEAHGILVLDVDFFDLLLFLAQLGMRNC